MKGGRFSRLKWNKPKGKPKALSVDRMLLADSAAGRAVRTMFQDVGIPTPKAKASATTPRDEAVFLLEAAAEVEHALLVQYLYAAYSLNPKAAAAKVLRSTIIEIAIEEMGHLISVQNLLLALGANPYFDRESIDYSGKPAGDYSFPITFEPLTSDSLAKYVTTEAMMLDQFADPDLKKKLKSIFDQADKANGGVSVNHVGALYAKLFWLFQSDDNLNPLWPSFPVDLVKPAGWHIADADFVGFDDKRQATASEFGRSPVTPSDPSGDDVYVINIQSRSEALFALSQIARQGEGPVTTENSHFARFLKGYDDFASIPAVAIRKVPTNPHTEVTKGSKPAAAASLITHPKTVLWARLFDVRYQILIMDLWLGTFTDPSTAGALSRSKLISAALSEMTDRIAFLAGTALPTMNLKDPATGEMAGAPFWLPDNELPAVVTTIKVRMKELIQKSKDLSGQITTLSVPNSPTSDEQQFLSDMATADAPFAAAL